MDAALFASRCMISLGAEAGVLTAAHRRALGMLASRSQWRRAGPAGALGAAPSSAGRMCDRLPPKGLLRTRRASRGRRAVLVSVIPAGRKPADGAAGGPVPQVTPARARAQGRP
jgi:DNA-binding MarR family transcriptional regulator